MKHRPLRFTFIVPVLFFLIVYVSQIFPYVHFHHTHDGERFKLNLSYHVEQTDFAGDPSDEHHHDHDDDSHDSNTHQHSYDDFIAWHFLRGQNGNVLKVSVSSALQPISEKLSYIPDIQYNQKENRIAFSSPFQKSPQIIRGPPLTSC